MASRRDGRASGGRRRLGFEKLESRELLAAQPIISEFLASNDDILPDEDGDYSDYIEIYNQGDETANLGGWYLTDNRNNLFKWAIPAVDLQPGEHLVIFASSKHRAQIGGELHTNFALSADGEYLALVHLDGTIATEFDPAYPVQVPDISFGLADIYEDGVFVGQEYRYFVTPTPGEANSIGVKGFVSEVDLSRGHGFINEPFYLSLSTETPGAAIYYTVDGSIPGPDNSASRLYSEPILIDLTTVFRTAAYKEDFARSAVSTESYIFIEDVLTQSIDRFNPANNPHGLRYPERWNGRFPSYNMNPSIVAAWDDNNPANDDFGIREALLALPSMSIVMDHDDLWDPTIGIYVNAEQRGDAWRRAGSVEYIDPDGGEGFQYNVGVQMHGGGSRTPAQPKHSFRLIFNSEFDGPGRLNFPLFDQSDFADINTIVLKGMNQDSFSVFTQTNKYSSLISTNMRDQWMLDAHRAMGNPSAEFTYVHLYINGLYWGLYEAAERIDDASMSSRFGGEPEDWDIINPYGEYSGSIDAWNAMYALARQIPANSPQTADRIYFELQGRNPDGTRNPNLPVYLDVDNMIDYLLLHYYAFAQEWNEGNFVAARNRLDPEAGFQFFPWDQDVSLNDYFVTRIAQTGLGTSTAPELRWLLRPSKEFQLRFADRIQKHFFDGGALDNEESTARWLRLAEQIEPAIIAESAKWGNYWAGVTVTRKAGEPPVILPTITIDHWRNSVDTVANLFPMFKSENMPVLANFGHFPTLPAPALSKFGGKVAQGFELHLGSPPGTPVGAKIFYTLDGSDPRLIGGAVSPTAMEYTAPITLDQPSPLKARILSGSTWSPLIDTSFQVVAPPAGWIPGDFDHNHSVDDADYLLWRENFGQTVDPWTGGDANGDSMVDAADYSLWRDHRGSVFVPKHEFSFTSIGQTYAEDFDAFRGSEVSLPSHFQLDVADGIDVYRGLFDSSSDTASSFTGIKSATSDGIDHALAWRESTGPANLDDARVLFSFTNDTGEAIHGFEVSYDVEAWVNGRRDNEVRFKYDIFRDSAAAQAAEGRNAFETNIVVTGNPNHTPIAANGDQFVLDGKSIANRVTVSTYVDLATLLIDEGTPALGVFGALQPGQTAHFRWQISNGALTEGNRSALAIDNLTITAVGAPASSAAIVPRNTLAGLLVQSPPERSASAVNGLNLSRSNFAPWVTGDKTPSPSSPRGEKFTSSELHLAHLSPAPDLLLATVAPDESNPEAPALDEYLVDSVMEEFDPGERSERLAQFLEAEFAPL